MSITLFVPSKDRPSQLRLLLQSLKNNLPLDEIDEIIISHTHSNENFAQGYSKLYQENIIKANWVIEAHSPKISIDAFLNGCKTQYVMLITDDSFVYRYIPTFRPAISLLEEHKNVLTFSLRLGFNTTVVDYTRPDRDESDVDSLLTKHECINKDKRKHAEGVYTWNWKSTKIPHFSHPISLDGTIIRLDDLKMLTADAEHNNYRQWECCISDYVKRFDKNLHGCFEHSSVVTIPINQVVDADKLTDGVHFPLSTKSMNDKYLSGWNIDYWSLIRECEYYVDTPLKEFPLTYRRSRWYDKFIGR